MYGHLRVVFWLVLGVFWIVLAMSPLIWTGDCPRVLAREKQGKARSAHNPWGGVSIRLIISSTDNSGRWGVRSCANICLKGVMYTTG